MSKVSRTRGKNAELAVARYIGSGTKRNHFEKEDLAHPILSIEVKHRENLPRLIAKWMTQAELAAPENKIPCVVAHEERMEYRNCICMIRLHDLIDLVGG